MNELNTYSFICEKEGGSQKISHAYICHSDTTWMPLMLQFASFLEGCGYVGVYPRVEAMIDDGFGEHVEIK